MLLQHRVDFIHHYRLYGSTNEYPLVSNRLCRVRNFLPWPLALTEISEVIDFDFPYREAKSSTAIHHEQADLNFHKSYLLSLMMKNLYIGHHNFGFPQSYFHSIPQHNTLKTFRKATSLSRQP